MNPKLTIADEQFGSISVRFDRWDGPSPQYEWEIDALGQKFQGSDLRMGARSTLNAAEALATLLGFLGAFAEAVAYSRHSEHGPSDNIDLFPDGMREWADAVGSDEFSMLADDLLDLGEEN